MTNPGTNNSAKAYAADRKQEGGRLVYAPQAANEGRKRTMGTPYKVRRSFRAGKSAVKGITFPI
jgi:hypothetical protein